MDHQRGLDVNHEDEFEREFGVDLSKVTWTNLFHETSSVMADGLMRDYGKLHTEESVTSASWLERLTEKLNEPTLIEEVPWEPSIEIIMEG